MGIRLLLKVNKLVCCSFDKASGEIGNLKLYQMSLQFKLQNLRIIFTTFCSFFLTGQKQFDYPHLVSPGKSRRYNYGILSSQYSEMHCAYCWQVGCLQSVCKMLSFDVTFLISSSARILLLCTAAHQSHRWQI